MSKASKEAIARLDGMDYALRRIREKGIEDFEREMQWRNENGISLPLTQQTINEGSWKIKIRTIDLTRRLLITVDKKTYDIDLIIDIDCDLFHNVFD